MVHARRPNTGDRDTLLHTGKKRQGKQSKWWIGTGRLSLSVNTLNINVNVRQVTNRMSDRYCHRQLPIIGRAFTSYSINAVGLLLLCHYGFISVHCCLFWSLKYLSTCILGLLQWLLQLFWVSLTAWHNMLYFWFIGINGSILPIKIYFMSTQRTRANMYCIALLYANSKISYAL